MKKQPGKVMENTAAAGTTTSSSSSVLPNGWKREEFSRPRGLSNGKYRVHYINELGQRFKNKCMLSRFMGNVDLTPFDWKTGKIDPYLKRKVERMIKVRECQDVNKRLRNDHTIKPPLRQTVSNFKLPVTIYRAQPKESPPVVPPTNSVMTRQVQNQIKQANNHEQQRAALAAAEAKTNNFKPRQIFWEKRLQGQHASINDENYEKFNLPRNIKPILSDHLSDDSVVRAIVTSLYDRNNTITVTGQATTRQEINKNPAIFLDPYQPPTQAIAVDDSDLKRQEERVQHYRKELERIIKLEIKVEKVEAKQETPEIQQQQPEQPQQQPPPPPPTVATTTPTPIKKEKELEHEKQGQDEKEIVEEEVKKCNDEAKVDE